MLKGKMYIYIYIANISKKSNHFDNYRAICTNENTEYNILSMIFQFDIRAM